MPRPVSMEETACCGTCPPRSPTETWSNTKYWKRRVGRGPISPCRRPLRNIKCCKLHLLLHLRITQPYIATQILTTKPFLAGPLFLEKMSKSFPERKILPMRSRTNLGQSRERRHVSNSNQGLSKLPVPGNTPCVEQPLEISPAFDSLSLLVSSERKILPARLTTSLEQPGELINAFSTLSASENAQRVERPVETTPASSNRSPPRSKSAAASYGTPSETESFIASSHEGNSFFFEGLAYGRKPKLQPDTMGLPPFADSQTWASDLSLPILSRLEPEDPQSLHTLYSDEKIVVHTENEDLGMPIPVLLNGNLASVEDGPSTPPPTRPPLFSQILELGSSPSLYPHERSVSVTSSISDISHYSDFTSPYDVGTEEAPLEPFFAPAFQTALKRGLDIAKDAADAMETAGQSLVEGADLQRLINDAKGLSTFKSSDIRIIAVLGDSGEGKHTSH